MTPARERLLLINILLNSQPHFHYRARHALVLKYLERAVRAADLRILRQPTPRARNRVLSRRKQSMASRSPGCGARAG